MKTTLLNGVWQLLPVKEFKDHYPEEGWLEMELPSHWQQHPDLEFYSGKMVYRKVFRFRRTRGKRYRLRLNGIFYRSTVHLNGQQLGENEGYFFPQEYEITGFLKGNNTLLVEVDCPEEEDKLSKTMITGVFSHWDVLDPKTNPGGIWLPVEIVPSGEVYIKASRLEVEDLSDETALVVANVALDAASAGWAQLRMVLTPHNFEGPRQSFQQAIQLVRGHNDVSMPITIEEPRLWWTHDQGFPHLYRVTLEVRTPNTKAPSDALESNFGLRSFEMRDWIAYLNGRRLFIKGNNYGPGDTRLATMNRERFEEDLQLAREAHMNMLRVHAHVEHPAFYEVADELGMLIWQDFPLQWNYAKEVLPEALRQVELMVDHLRNHPSIVVWCMHNEPGIVSDPSERRLWPDLKTLFSLLVYNWNREVMDRRLKRRVEELDDSRFVVRSSGEWSVRLLRRGTDSHVYYGWYRGQDPARKLDGLGSSLRFLTEFGAQSFPNYESSVRFMSPELADLDWDHLGERHGLQRRIMDKWLNLDSYRDLKELIEASQDYQIALNRQYIDRLRYHKYRPTGGVLAFSFHDPNPAVQWSVVDYWRVPKRSYYHMQGAFHPQYVFTLLDRGEYHVGEEIALPVYVVNDAQESYDEVAISAEILDAEGHRTTRASFQTSLGSDSEAELVQLMHLRFSKPGERTLLLTLGYGDQVFENKYPLLITPS
ncbi:MAG: glycoside hydrolase [Anaerolineae bacterium]|nr:glycoside hydrolase [Anaerolineae bacterium]NIO00292.1 glycoside hydrolase [Anaerolineae bacterium]NIQ83074.1 glycoside hydrolase [Anaerolineae bacterium]